MQKVTLGELYRVKPGLQTLVQTPLPVKASMQMAKLIATLNPVYTTLEKEHNKLVMLYGEKNEAGNMQITKEMPNWAAFLDARNKLLAQEVDLPEFEPVIMPVQVPTKCPQCGRVEPAELQLPAELLLLLERFVTVAEA
jgi:hypothetical protein